MIIIKNTTWDFSGDPVVGTLLSNAGVVGSTPGLGAKILQYDLKKKMVHILKKSVKQKHITVLHCCL